MVSWLKFRQLFDTAARAGPVRNLRRRRGRVLVMGGDQVYPVPKRGEYHNRFLGPYRAGLPCSHGQLET